MPAERGATIRDVARVAGVSSATVSRVLSGKSSVDPEFAEKVRIAVKELGYWPSAMAQGLARGRSGTIGVLVPDLANPYFYNVLRGIERSAERDDVWMVVADSHENPEVEFERALELARRSDALVLCSPRMDEASLRRLRDRHPNIVCTHRSLPQVDIPSVCTDVRRGASLLVEHLRAAGHRRVAYLSGPAYSWSNGERLAVLAEARGIEIDVIECGATMEDGYSVIDVELASRVTAIMGYNDLVALGALSRLNELGVRAPQDIALAGFDDIAFARFTSPSLTTVRMPTLELGEEVWRNLSALLAGLPAPKPRLLPTELIVRESTLSGPRA